MKSYEVVGWTHEGDILCPSCARAGGLPRDEKRQFDEEWGPVFADSEFDRVPMCGECGDIILCSYTQDAIVDYLANRNVEVFEVTREDIEPGHFAEDLGPGWYWWIRLPGCLPDSEAEGPFTSEQHAIDDAARDFDLI